MHERIESGLALLDPALDAGRLGAVVARLAGFWAGTEPVIDAWARGNSGLADAWQWPRRRRAAHTRTDLDALGWAGDVPLAPAVFGSAGAAEVLGWLYVAEGSTLGGAVIERRLRDVLARWDVRLRSFTPYDEGPGPMWRAYLTALDEWTGSDDLRSERVVAASVATFDALQTWVTPIFGEAAA